MPLFSLSQKPINGPFQAFGYADRLSPIQQNATQPSKIEEAYTLIDHGLTTITRELALAA